MLEYPAHRGCDTRAEKKFDGDVDVKDSCDRPGQGISSRQGVMGDISKFVPYGEIGCSSRAFGR